MKLTLTQQVIMAEIKKSGSITARRVMEITGCVYRDSMDYVYQTLGRMVKAGLIRRAGPGVFKAVGGEKWYGLNLKTLPGSLKKEGGNGGRLD
jgi:hypothetical protein